MSLSLGLDCFLILLEFPFFEVIPTNSSKAEINSTKTKVIIVVPLFLGPAGAPHSSAQKIIREPSLAAAFTSSHFLSLMLIPLLTCLPSFTHVKLSRLCPFLSYFSVLFQYNSLCSRQVPSSQQDLLEALLTRQA